VEVGPVSTTLQSLFVVLGGVLLGPRAGAAAAALYLLAGAAGLPVFAGGRGGVRHLIGPTGGYLFGFVLAAWLAGRLGSAPLRAPRAAAAALLAQGVLAAVGGVWFLVARDQTWAAAAATFGRLLPGLLIKALAAGGAVWLVQRIAARRSA